MQPIAPLPASVQRTAASEPDRLAIIAPDGRATYAELVRVASVLAERYRALGVEPGDRVGVVLPPGRAAITGALAALMSGAAYVSIDPVQPAALVEEMLSACDVRVCTAAADVDALYAEPGRAAGKATSGYSDVAYIMHTSGSTGTPKAVQVQHDSVVNLAHDLAELAPVAPGHCGGWWTSPSFDVSIWEVWSPLLSGGTVAVVPPEDRLEAQRLVAFLDRAKVASAYIPPGLLADVRDLLVASPQRCAALTRLLVGVEPIPLGLLQELMAGRPGLTVVNGYGPAETTICATLYRVPRTGGAPEDRTPIGKPVHGNRIHVVDGELIIAGRGVARGYVGSVSGGFTTEPGAPDQPAYRTGDLVRRLADGNLVFEGRVDRQLKVRGYRVEPGEIEVALRRVGRFREIVVDQRDTGQSIAAYVVAAQGFPVDPIDLRARLRPLLAPHAIPTYVIAIERIPQTSNGKTDYAALAALHAPVSSGDQYSGYPENAVLTAIRRELGDPGAPADVAFVELGGTSLAASRVAAALRDATGREVSWLDVLQASSADDLARALTWAPAETVMPTESGRSRGPLSVAQTALWLHEVTDPDPERYLESLCFDIEGKLDIGRFIVAVASSASIHGVFGARVAAETGLPQWVLDAVEVPVDAVDVPSGTDVTQLIDVERRCPFDLERGPLMRCRLLIRDELSATVVFSWHHLAIDGWSARVFLGDVARSYAGEAVVRPQRTLCDLAIEQQSREIDPNGMQDLLARLRRSQLAVTWPVEGDTADVFPVRHPPTTDAGWIEVEVAADLVERAAAAARRLQVTVHVLLMTAFQQAIESTLDVRDFLIGCAYADRDLSDVDRVAGYLINSTLLPAGNPEHLPLSELLQRNASLSALAARDAHLPFTAVVNELLRGVQPRPTSFPQIYFSYDDAPRLDLGDGVTCTRRPLPGGTPKFDLTLELDRDGDRMAGRLGYRASVLSQAGAVAVASAFLDVMSSSW